MGPPQRPQREGERGQQAVAGGERQVDGIDAGPQRDRDQRAEAPGRQERQRHAGGEPDDDAHQPQRQHLDQVHGDHEAAAGAEAFQRRDGLALAVDEAAHGIGDADAAHHQRGQADQRQELGEAADVAVELRRGVEARARPPAGVGEGGLRRRHRGLQARIRPAAARQRHAVAPADQAARLDQPAGAQALLRHHEPRTELEPAGDLVGLARQHRADLVVAVAHPHPLADRDAQPVDQRRRGQRECKPEPVQSQVLHAVPCRRVDAGRP